MENEEFKNEIRLEKALDFGRAAHNSIGQKRKYSGEPYWVHTEAVSNTVKNVGGSIDMIIASLLHDVEEDVAPHSTYYNIHTITDLFGVNVANLVIELTDVYTKVAYPKLNRKQRHELENERLSKISPEAKTIKLADLLDNTKSIVKDDPDFAVTYMREKKALLPLLKEGNPELYEWALKSIEAYYA